MGIPYCKRKKGKREKKNRRRVRVEYGNAKKRKEKSDMKDSV